MSSPVFTVVIPLYNRANVIEGTIRSVLEQSFQDFEIVVVDDGSSDNPQPVVEAIGDSRIRFFQQANSGANTARNRGIDEALGAYVAFLDSDDKFLPHHLAAAKAVLDDSPQAVVYAKIIVDRGNSTEFQKPPRAIRAGEHMATYLMCDRGFVQTSTLVVPTPLARSVRYLDGLPYGQDIDFAVRLFGQGAQFIMLERPSAIWLDVSDPKRISSQSVPEVRLKWLEGIKSQIPDRAYYGFRGWFVAKAYTRRGDLAKGLALYFDALRHRAYGLKLSGVILVQLLLSGGAYRTFANLAVSVKSLLRPAR